MMERLAETKTVKEGGDMTEEMRCPKCGSGRVVKNGTMKRWRGFKSYRVQMLRCKVCGKVFTGYVLNVLKS